MFLFRQRNLGTVMGLLLFWSAVLWTDPVLAVGQSNVFGLFRKRRDLSAKVQDKREEINAQRDKASSKAWWQRLPFLSQGKTRSSPTAIMTKSSIPRQYKKPLKKGI
jgi:hypothetical protein